MKKIRVLTYNIHKGRSFLKRNRIWNHLSELFALTEPDIVFLQEFLKEPDAEELLEGLADSFWPHHSYGKNAFSGDFHYGNAIISRFPLHHTDNRDISNTTWERRGLLYANVKLPKVGEIHLFCTHLDLTPWGREKQRIKVQESVAAKTKLHEPILFGGDFNDWSQTLSPHFEQELDLHDAFFYKNGYTAKTSPSFFPILALDRIYFRSLHVKHSLVLNGEPWKALSDHLPLLADFDF